MTLRTSFGSDLGEDDRLSIPLSRRAPTWRREQCHERDLGPWAAFTAYYGNSSFNQGAPKPDGTGEAPIGTIDPETGAYVLDWTSQIVGGSFNDFVGVWHLEGTFTPGS